MCTKAGFLAGMVVVGGLAAGVAQAVVYTGSLAYTGPGPADTSDGLYVLGPQWPSYNLNMTWTVTDQDNSQPGYPWKYTYTFAHNGTQAGFSHIIIEGSEGISDANIVGLTGATLSSWGLQTVLSGNPNMPEDFNGLRFNPPQSGLFSMTWTFWSNRQPVWGDFYARCGGAAGGTNSAYNYNEDSNGVERGFLDPNNNDTLRDDVDPLVAASSGSVDFHILVPDSVVPEPATVLFIVGGAVGLLRRRLVRA
jgi:hypothetical protein